MKLLSNKAAIIAIYEFLGPYYFQGYKDLGNFLSPFTPRLDGTPVDPALYQDWLEVINNKKQLHVEEAYFYMLKFLEQQAKLGLPEIKAFLKVENLNSNIDSISPEQMTKWNDAISKLEKYECLGKIRRTTISDMIQLIMDYQAMVKDGVLKLQEFYGTEDLLTLRQKKVIAETVTLPSGHYFKFYDKKCALKFNDINILFEFGPNNRYDGFDPVELGRFIEGHTFTPTKKIAEMPEIYRKYAIRIDWFREDFGYLIENNIIYKPDPSPDSNLYFFVDKNTE